MIPKLPFFPRPGSRHAVAEGDRHRDARRWRQAAKAYRAYLERNPGDADIWVQYGHAMKEAGDHEAASAAYRRAMAAGLDDADVHLQFGHVLKLRGMRREATSAYAEALRRDPDGPHALSELQALGWTRSDFRRVLSEAAQSVDGSNGSRRSNGVARTTLAFDVTDLVHFMANARRPTGIQRVQSGVIGAVLDEPPQDVELMLVCFSDAAAYWVELPADLLRRAFIAMATGGTTSDAEWRQVRAELSRRLVLGNDADFPMHTCLINIGSSWAFANYFLALRRARAASRVTFVPLVHDCFPVVVPEFFVPGLQRDFREWLRNIYRHADAILANSDATAADVRRLAAAGGYRPPTVTTVRLDAPFALSPRAMDTAGDADALSRLGLEARAFVLFVGTIEPRKNHLLAFETWARLIAERGEQSVPDLVCVGGDGWRNRPILERLEYDSVLSRRVRILRGVSDEDLAALYRGCRFTVYPSHLEGWGLPVTESLSMGRIPLIARTSSLPEAGGDLAAYFDPDDERDFQQQLTQLIDDTALVSAMEARIAEQFRPRGWPDIARQIVDVARAVDATSPEGVMAAKLPYATFVRLARDLPGAIASGVPDGEALRSGAGWAALDEEAAWINCDLDASAELRFQLCDQPESAKAPFDLLLQVLVGHPLPHASTTKDAIPDNECYLLVTHGDRVDEVQDKSSFFRLTFGRPRWVRVPIEASAAKDVCSFRFAVKSVDARRKSDRPAGITSVFLAASDDAAARQKLLEGIVFGAMENTTAPLPVELLPMRGLLRGATAEGATRSSDAPASTRRDEANSGPGRRP